MQYYVIIVSIKSIPIFFRLVPPTIDILKFSKIFISNILLIKKTEFKFQFDKRHRETFSYIFTFTKKNSTYKT